MIMKEGELTMRVWATSLVVGCAISCVLSAAMWATRIAFYFPPFWPGLFFAWVIVIVAHGEQWSPTLFITIATIGNAGFYAWLFSRVIGAEIRSRGSLSRWFLR